MVLGAGGGVPEGWVEDYEGCGCCWGGGRRCVSFLDDDGGGFFLLVWFGEEGGVVSFGVGRLLMRVLLGLGLGLFLPDTMIHVPHKLGWLKSTSAAAVWTGAIVVACGLGPVTRSLVGCRTSQNGSKARLRTWKRKGRLGTCFTKVSSWVEWKERQEDAGVKFAKVLELERCRVVG